MPETSASRSVPTSLPAASWPVPPLHRDRLVVGGAALLVLALLLPAVLALSSSMEVGFVLSWLSFSAQAVGAVLVGGGVVLRELARRGALRGRQGGSAHDADGYA